jgi:hypothetical protein
MMWLQIQVTLAIAVLAAQGATMVGMMLKQLLQQGLMFAGAMLQRPQSVQPQTCGLHDIVKCRTKHVSGGHVHMSFGLAGNDAFRWCQ